VAKSGKWYSQSTRRYVSRSLIVVATFATAFQAGSNAFVNATRLNAPQIALTADKSDALALAVREDTRWAAAAGKGEMIDVSPAILRSLRGQAVNARAIRLLAFSADARGDRTRAEHLSQIAAQLSRRESGAQLWLMENSVEKNDVAAVLERYDVLLNTNPSMQQQLYPKLALALSDAEIRTAFVPYIRKAPAWLKGFLDHALGMPNPDALSYAIRQAGGLPKSDLYQPYVSGLLGQLFAKQKYAEARAFFDSVSGSDPQVVTSAEFSDAGMDPRFKPMSWALESNFNAGAAFEKSRNARTVLAFALSGETGIAAHKYFFLPPGKYRFGSVETITTPSANSRAAWVLRCMSTSEQGIIYQHDIIRSTKAASPSMHLTIPTNCPVQRLDLVLSGGDGNDGLELRVARIGIGS
jgi:hypothetical protein